MPVSLKAIFIIFYTSLIFFSSQVYSQDFTLKGKVLTSVGKESIPGATIVILQPKDSLLVKGTVTDLDGTFLLEISQMGNFLIKIDFVGYSTLWRKVNIEKSLDLGVLELKENVLELNSVQIIAKAEAVIQKGDTTQFTAAAYKTPPDASAEEIVEKLPGITIEDGKIQANGEEVQQILVDGKPFFGGSVEEALQNLPAGVVANIQVYDKQSDKTTFSGFNDGQHQKVINIITKPDRRKGQFGKATGGSGTSDTYHVGGSINFFNNDRRFTVSGLHNNINTYKQNPTINTLSDVSNQKGITEREKLGLNFTNSWGDRFEISSNYQFNRNRDTEGQFKYREFLNGGDTGRIYTEERKKTSLRDHHTLKTKIRFKPDTFNLFVMRPGLSLIRQQTDNQFAGLTTRDELLINKSNNTSTSDTRDNDFTNSLYYSHRFKKGGRTITVGFNGGIHMNNDDHERHSAINRYNKEDSLTVIDRESNRDRDAVSWKGQVSFTEPFGNRSLVEMEYEVSDKPDKTAKLTYEKNEEGSYSLLDTLLSNSFQNRYSLQSMELGYKYSFESIRFQAEGKYQKANLHNNQKFPVAITQDNYFQRFLPSARFNYQISDGKRLELDYRTSTREPSIWQLQNLINNSNPLFISAGNPQLRQSYYHRTKFRFWLNDIESEKSFYGSINSSIVKDLITQAIWVASQSSIEVNNVFIDEGAQFSQPINVSGYYALDFYINHSRPIDLIQSRIRFSSGYKVSRRPGQIDNQVLFTKSRQYRLGMAFNSNFSEDMSVNLYMNSSYNQTDNTLNPERSNSFVVYNTRLKYRWILPNKLVYRMDVKHRLNTAFASGPQNRSTLLNLSAGKKFLKDDVAEISLNVYDLLAQNNNARQSISELYVEDQESTILEKYFIMTFTYNIRHFSPGSDKEEYRGI